VAQIDILLEPLHSELVDEMTTIRFEVRTQAHLLTFPLLPVVTRPAPERPRRRRLGPSASTRYTSPPTGATSRKDLCRGVRRRTHDEAIASASREQTLPIDVVPMKQL
jgi:hypothetical protein